MRAIVPRPNRAPAARVVDGTAAPHRPPRGNMDLLWKEVHHRVKNNLQVISSLLSLQARTFEDAKIREKWSDSQGRIRSIALVHDLLYHSKRQTTIDFGEYVALLAADLAQTHGAAHRGIAVEVEGRGVLLAADLAVPCGLIANELLTNSLKHAFPDHGGTIFVRLVELDPQRLELSIKDDGVGLRQPFDPKHVASLGLELVLTFAAQIDASLHVESPPGTTFRLTFRRIGREET